MRLYLLNFARKEAGLTMVEVAAAEEAGVLLLLFLVLGLLRACNRGAESGERGEKCVSISGPLNEALVVVGG